MARQLSGWILAAIALAVLLLAWGEVYSPLNHTTFGVTLAPHGSSAAILQVMSGSAAAQAGLRAGDIVDLSRMTMSERLRLQVGSSPVDTALRIPVLHNGQRREVTLVARSGPDVASLRIGSAGLLISATLTLLIVALIAIRRPSVATAALVLYGTGSVTTPSVVSQFTFLPSPWFGTTAVLIYTAFSVLPLVALLPFMARFPETPQSKSGRFRMRLADLAFLAGAIFFTYESIYEPLVFATWYVFNIALQVTILAAVLILTIAVYREATGEARSRIAWVLAGLAVSSCIYFAVDLDIIVYSAAGAPWSDFATNTLSVLSCAFVVALAYAILRHRVLDIGFALNRTVVYAVTTSLAVAVVGLVDWLSSRLVSEQRFALAVEAFVIICFGFALNWIHTRTERLIDRIVFRERHIAEKRIEYRIGAMGFATSASAVDSAIAEDAARILGLVSAAIFGRFLNAQAFTLDASTGWRDDAPVTIDDDSVLVRTLQSLERPIILEDADIALPEFPAGAARPVLAVPIAIQHELIGFALYGSRRDGSLPDPEEISLLQRLCAAAANAYRAVEARHWRERVIALEPPPIFPARVTE